MKSYTDWTRVVVIVGLSLAAGTSVTTMFLGLVIFGHVDVDKAAAGVVAVVAGLITAGHGAALGFMTSPKTPPSTTTVAVAHADVVNSTPPPPMPPVTP